MVKAELVKLVDNVSTDEDHTVGTASLKLLVMSLCTYHHILAN